MASDETITNIYLSMRQSIARSVMGIIPPKEVEDIVQETYVRICQAGDKERIRKPQSFIFRTARNLALDHAKRAETRLTVSMKDDQELYLENPQRNSDKTFDEVASNEEFAQYCEAVRLLPVKCRRVYVLKKVYGFSIREIALELKISESTVKNQVVEGTKRCAYFLMRENPGLLVIGGGDLSFGKPQVSSKVNGHE